MGLIQRLGCLLLLILLTGCGGGGSLNGDNDGSTPGTGDNDVVTVILTISDKVVTDESPAEVTAIVMKGDSPLADKLITFSINDEELAFFESPTSGTTSTNDQGLATITLKAGSKGGSGFITATVDSITSINLVFDSKGDGNSGTNPSVANISLFANTQQMSSDGLQEVTLTAIAKNAGNNLLEGITVVFKSDSGDLEVTDAVTGPDGKATATLTTQNAQANRFITTTVTSGEFNDSVSIQVIGTTVSLTGSSSLALDDQNTYIIKLLDSSSHGIANEVVMISLTDIATVNGGAVAGITLPQQVTTDKTGQAKVELTGTTGGTNSITVSALGATSTKDVAVQADSFLFSTFHNSELSITDPSEADILPDVLLSNTATITLTWLRNGTSIPDGTRVDFSSTRGDLSASSATTVGGKVTTTLTSSVSGKSLVTFTGTDNDIVLSNQIEFEFVAETVDSVVAQAFPKSIGPSAQTSTISVVVRDIAGNLVKNKKINFKLIQGSGSIFPADAVTDSNGVASTVFTSSSVSSVNGISVTAVVDEDSSLNDTVTLTVADRGLFITLGTGNDLIEKDSTNYTKQYSVFVTDVNSNPIANMDLTVSAVPKTFYKGQWVKSFDASGSFKSWVADWQQTGSNPTKFGCPNEDLNIDGILDDLEDTNGDDLLTPGNVVAALGTITTDDDGLAIINLDYPQSFAQWVDIKLIVSGQVSGTESYTQVVFTLPVLNTDVTKEDLTPPTSGIGLNGPFGATALCTSTD